jgi:DNA mismatch repair protein MSH5
LAFAAAAIDFQLVRPGMHHDNAIHIKGGRHILYERVTENYVSNDTALFGRGDSRDDHATEAEDEHVGSIVGSMGACIDG